MHQPLFYKKSHRALYAAFEVFPSFKGSATHIHYFSKRLLHFMGDLALFTLADSELKVYDSEKEGQIEIYRFKFLFDNYLERAKAFSELLQYAVASQPELKIAHFRDPWSGYPILKMKSPSCKAVYEVNALYSIELVQLYPLLHPDTLAKIYQIEQFCLEHSDKIIAVSKLLIQALLKRGIPANKIEYIPNGYDEQTVSQALPVSSSEPYLLYFGGLQPWQGIDILIRALAYLAIPSLKLKIIVSQRKKNLKFYEKLIHKLNLEHKVEWHYEMPREELFGYIQNAFAVVVPLTDCARNSEQGCCPFKIIESMGNGALVIASDLPSTREWLQHQQTGLLCQSNRPSELARTIQWAFENPTSVQTIRQNALQYAKEHLTWEKQLSKLQNLYESLFF